MSFLESLMTAVFLMVFVFFVLILLYLLIRLFTVVLDSASQVLTGKTNSTAQQTNENKPEELDDSCAFGGTLRLQEVDEPTAAMIMAIVSDESGIPLSQLCFKSIKAISNNTKMEAKA